MSINQYQYNYKPILIIIIFVKTDYLKEIITMFIILQF